MAEDRFGSRFRFGARPPNTQHLTPNSRARSAHSWWARRWIEALEALGWEARLARGRTYARAGNVRSIDIQPGRVTARVKGSRPQPYTVRIELPALSDDDWARVVEALAGQ